MTHPAIAQLGFAPVPADQAAPEAAVKRWNAVAKPIGSLGLLEDALVRIAATTGSADIDISRRCVAVLCSDNGVVAQGVSQSGPDVTTVVAANVAAGVSSVCKMAHALGMDAVAVDMGMLDPPAAPGLRDAHVARGTADISCGPAMTCDQALQAIHAGAQLVGDLRDEGYRIVATGEMGIGNTTTSSAMACVLLDQDPREVVGRGAGLADDGLERKLETVKRAIQVNMPYADALDVLAKLGGFDIAGMCGMFIGAAHYRVPIVIDGLISAVAALCAFLLEPGCVHAMLASHVSAEPAARLLLDALGLKAPLQAGLRLGEGTGAVCLIPLLDAALALYNGTTFDDCGIEAYEVHPR